MPDHTPRGARRGVGCRDRGCVCGALPLHRVHRLRRLRRVAAASVLLICGAFVAALVGTGGAAQAGIGSPSDCTRPYSDASPWNTRIATGVPYEPNSAARVAAIGGSLSSDPTQFTYPVYYATASTPTRQVQLSGWLSRSSPDGATFGNVANATVQVPVPAGAAPAAGSDAQVIIVDLATGYEWGFFNFATTQAGTLTAVNGYQYAFAGSATPVHAHGNGFVARGGGVPYLAGLVRPCEIQGGSIEHALAFAYDAPSGEFVYPASKSDGKGSGPLALPEGARLQLNPALSEAQIRAWGCDGACLTIARALQQYGMYVVDNAGRAKVMIEFDGTAHWNGLVTAATVAPIPLAAFRVLALGSGAAAPPGSGTPPGESSQPSGSKADKKKVKPTSKGSKRLKVAGFRVRGRHLRADGVFRAIMTVRPSKPTGRVPAKIRLRCRARIGNSAVPIVSARLRRLSGRRVRAVCRWSIPPGVRGERLRASVSVGYRGGETTIRFVGRIRRAL